MLQILSADLFEAFFLCVFSSFSKTLHHNHKLLEAQAWHTPGSFFISDSDCKWWAKPCMLLLPAQTTESGGLFNWVLQHVSRVMVTWLLYSVYPLRSVNITPFVQFVPTRRSESRSQQKRSKAFLAANSIQYEFNLPLPMGHFQPTSTFKCSGTDGQNQFWLKFIHTNIDYLLLFWDTHTLSSASGTLDIKIRWCLFIFVNLLCPTKG